MKKPKLIIIEGAIASYKSTVTRALREELPSTVLISLSGLPKEKDNANSCYRAHSSVLNMIDDTWFSGMNYVLDRSHISNQVYSRLGLKGYDFEVEGKTLTCIWRRIAKRYDIYYISLSCSNNEEAVARLGQRHKHEYVSHNLEMVKSQRAVYHEIFDEIKKNNFLNATEIDTSSKTSQEVLEEILDTLEG